MQKYCDIVGEDVDKEDCDARKKQALQFREKGQPHASLEKCIGCTKMMTEPAGDTIRINESSALICSHCKRGPGAIASVWIKKRGMHQSCYQNQQLKKKKTKEAKLKPAATKPKKPQKQTKVFKVGDIVKHRASGKEGIVSSVSYTCEVHAPIQMCALRTDRSTCKLKRTGFYTVNINFNDDIQVHEIFIEAKVNHK